MNVHSTFSSSAGLIEVFIGDSVYKPLISVAEENPLPIKWVSFDSLESSRVLFFFECVDRLVVSPSIIPPDHQLLAKSGVVTKEGNTEASMLTKGMIRHSFVKNDIYFWTALGKQCKHVRAWEDKYADFIKVASIKNAKSDEFALRLPFYVQGIRDANILVSSGADTKNNYEIGSTHYMLHWMCEYIWISLLFLSDWWMGQYSHGDSQE